MTKAHTFERAAGLLQETSLQMKERRKCEEALVFCFRGMATQTPESPTTC